MGKILLVEYDAGYIDREDEIGKKYLIENKLDKKEEMSINGIPLIVFAVLQKYGVQNNNRRIYPEHILRREIDKYQKYCIPERNTLMEVNHPESTHLNLLNGGGAIIDCWWEGITALGKIKLNLSKGFINDGYVFTSGDHVANLMLNNIKVGVSSRGVGSLKDSGKVNVVQDDYDLICWDFVNQPSSRGSWVSDNLEELKPYVEKTITEQKNQKRSMSDVLNTYLGKFN